MFASPAVAGNLLYIGSCSGICYALDKNTGKEIWTFDAKGNSFHGDPILTDELLIIPTDDRPYEGSSGPIFALDRVTGELKWRYDITSLTQLGSGVTTDLLRDQSRVIGVTTTERVICLNLNSGELIWDHQGAYDPDMRYWNSSPALMPGRVMFYGTQDGWLNMVSLNDGLAGWRQNVETRVTTSVVISDSSIYYGGADGRLHRSSLVGEPLASIELGGEPGFRLSSDGSAIYVFAGGDLDFSGMQSLKAISADLSKVLWTAPANRDTPWSIKKPYLYKNYVIAGDADGVISFFDARSGEIKWTFAVEGEVRSIGVTENVLYVGTIQGTVYAVRVNL